MTEQAFFSLLGLLLYILHAGIYLLKHRTERVSEYLAIRYCVTFS